MRILLFPAFLLIFPASLNASEVSHESEAGVVIANGNSHTESYSVKTKTEWKHGPDTYSLGGHFLRATANKVESAENWMITLRYEHAFTEPLSGFLAQSVEGDIFAGIKQRYNSDAGAKYHLFRLERDFLWFGEGGYRFTREHSTRGTKESFHKLRILTEAEKYWNEMVSTKLWVEYLPNLTKARSWLLNSELSLNAALSSIFSVKTGILLRYNNTPPVATTQKADTTFTTALVAKF
jgi:putative salt-induced outer membrane protein YdiY